MGYENQNRISFAQNQSIPENLHYRKDHCSGAFYKDIQEVEVTLVNEVKGSKEIVLCTLNIRVPGKDEYVKGKSSIFEDAVLKALDAAKRRLRIRKTQLQNARKKKVPNRTLNK